MRLNVLAPTGRPADLKGGFDMSASSRALILLLIAALAASVPAVDAGATRFGRNKVQYGAFDWSIVRTEHFDVYFYEGSEDLADAVSEMAELANSEFEAILGHELTTVIPVIIYASHNDFRQTNVSDSHISETVGGFTELFKNRVVVPFTGSYEDLRHVLYHELTHVFMFDIVYGGLVESVIRQAYSNPVPLWFVEGLAEYVSNGWDSEAEMIIRDLTLSDMVIPLQYLRGGYLVYKEGQSAMCFLADTYGPEKIRELVKAVARTHNLERALVDATGMTTPELSKEWEDALREKYWPEISERNRGEDEMRLLTDHSADDSYMNFGPSVSPDGQRVAYLTDRSGYLDLCVASTLDGKVLARPVRGERSNDFETLHVLRPGTSWSPDGSKLCLVAKAGASDVIHIIDWERGRIARTLRFDLDGLFTPSWSPDGGSICFVGTSRGASDLYVTDLATGELTRLTHDFYDEREPEWSPDGRRIAFASDRDAPRRDDLKRSYDLYALDVETQKVEPVVMTPAGESSPAWSPDGSRIAYVSDESGSPQLYLADLRLRTSVRVTRLVGGVDSPSWSAGADRMALALYNRSGWDIATVKAPLEVFAGADTSSEPFPSIDRTYAEAGDDYSALTWHELAGSCMRLEPVPPSDRPARADSVNGPAPDDMVSRDDAPVEIDSSDDDGDASDDNETVSRARAAYRSAVGAQPLPMREPPTVADEDERVPGTVEKYRPRFTPDWVSGAFGYTSGYGLSGSAQIAISDVLGNHRFYISSDFFSSLDSSNFQVVYERLANRLNLSVGVYNFKEYYYSDRTWLGEDLGEKRYFTERSYGVSVGLSYPFSMFSRVELDVSALSMDRQYAEESATGIIELTDEEIARSLVIPSVRFVNDTTLWGSVGPLSGGRSSLVLQRAWETGGDFQYVTAIADVRKYLRIGSRHSLAVKLVAARSSAANAQNFYIGGINSLRGYDDYEFHGRNLALASLEFRYPFIDHLVIASPVPLTLWGLRGVMFLDTGAAWDDSFRGVSNGPDGRHLDDIRAGYGFGVRMNLSLFVVRVDWAWPTDLRTTGEPVTHFALGAEF
jgi:hypothetical protein